MQVRRRLNLQVGEYDWQSSMGCVRLFIFGFLLALAIAIFAALQLDKIDPIAIADGYRAKFFYFHYLPEWVLVAFAFVFNGSTFRYMLAPISAIVIIIIAGTYYVKDIYALPNFNDALQYVLASMFGVGYPSIRITKGTKEIIKGQTNLIDKIGGPGFVVIEPGNAAMFRQLRGPSHASVSETYFLSPFESIASTANLDEQQGMKDKVTAMTRDGIKVIITDIQFRYRIRQEEQSGVPVKRSTHNPYPFSEEAIRNMTFNLMVEKNGLETWRAAVERSVTGTITDFVSAHMIDYITAPRTDSHNARLELRNQFFVDSMRSRLARLGAELLWVDVGHVEIEDESVDELRTTLWSADWAGDANEVRAYGEAVREAYQELGRAEAQADLIISIAGALADANLSGNNSENVRRLFLARTAQIMNAMNTAAKEKEKEEKK